MKYLPVLFVLLGLVALAAVMGGAGEQKRRAAVAIVVALAGVLVMAVLFAIVVDRVL